MNYNPEINNLLERIHIKNKIASILETNDKLPPNSLRTCIFVYGKSGIGKTTFIKNILYELNYDVLLYDAADIRNKSTIDQITKTSVCTNNVFHMLHQKTKKIVIVMDEIEGMNNGDRGGINTLIKLIRPKLNKNSNNKDNVEMFHCNLICICNHNIDKKISEIMKLCSVIYMQPPTNAQMNSLTQLYLKLETNNIQPQLNEYIQIIINHSQNDLRKLLLHLNLLKTKSNKQLHDISQLIAQNIYSNNFNINVKNVIYKLINHDNVVENEIFTSETNRTMISLIWHENIIDFLQTNNTLLFLQKYQTFLEYMCIGDYIDRITFLKQIWQLNEMTSLIKVLYNQSIIKDIFDLQKIKNIKPSDIRFTKVLTKYSSEYNNYLFLQSMCERFNLDRNDLLSFITCAIYKHNNITCLIQELSNYKISPIEIKRLYKFINKIDYNTSKNTTQTSITKNYIYKKTTKLPTKNKINQNIHNENINDSNHDFILSDDDDEAYNLYKNIDSTLHDFQNETNI